MKMLRMHTWMALLLLTVGSCKEIDVEPEKILVDMTIEATETPRGPVTGAFIFSKVTVSGPDDCTTFSRFDVYKRNPLLFEVRAKAVYPAPNLNVNCAPGYFKFDTTLRITTETPGQHILEFYNGNVLFKRDTVLVN
jgi:hypothetical protein